MRAIKEFLIMRRFPLEWSDIKVGQFAVAYPLAKYGQFPKNVIVKNDGIGMQIWSGLYPPNGYLIGSHKYRFKPKPN